MEKNLAQRLRDARQLLGLTQVQLSKASGIKQSDISKIERGETLRPTGLIALARVLNISPHWLADGEGEMTPSQTGATNVTPFPVVTLEAAMERLSYFLEQVPQADRGSSSAALAALALNPADHARKAALIKLLIEPSPASETEKFGAKVPKS